MKNKLLIIGASGHGRVVADIAQKMNSWKQIAFLDDDENIEYSMGIPIIGKTQESHKFILDYDIFVAIGNNQIREKIHNYLKEVRANIPILIHPNATVGDQVKLGDGTVVMAGAVINCCSKIGEGCIVNTGATLDHDNVIEDYVHISPGAHLAGTVRVGKSSWLGIGSMVSNNINITSNCVIGAGAAVIRDISEAGTYIGVPAKKVKDNSC